MSKSEFVVVGDLHYDGMNSIIPLEKRVHAVDNVMKQVQDYCMDNHIDTIIQVGDVCNSPSPSFLSYLSLLKVFNSKFKYHMIIGNHDYRDVNYNSLSAFSAMTRLGMIPNCKFYSKPAKQEIDGVRAIFLPWPYEKTPEEHRPSVIFGHFPAGNYMVDNNSVRKAEKIDLQNHFWILGDIHFPQHGKNFVYVGSALQANFGEKPNKRFLHVRVQQTETTNRVSFKSIKINLPIKLITVDADSVGDLGFLKSVKENEYVRIRGSSEIVAAGSKISIDNPNVVVVPKAKQTATHAIEGKVDLGIDHIKILVSHLKNVGLDRDQIRRAVQLVKAAGGDAWITQRN